MMDYIKIINDIIETSGKKYDSLSIINKEGIVEYTKRIKNDLDMISYDKERMGKTIFEAFQNLNVNNSSVLKTIYSGKVTKNERQVLISGNTKVVVEGDTYPIFDDHGNLQGVVDALRYLEYYNYNKANDSEDDGVLSAIVTKSQKLKRIKDRLPEIAKNDSNVFLYGETGTGKEIFARAIHLLSNRKNHPMITQNCAAIPQNLMESTFFGTETGGFTGAENKLGLFELANHGTLFLDEINSMDVQMQAKLLTAMEKGVIRRVGGQRDIPFDTRIICASNEQPQVLMQSGRFREDFYYRISSVKISIPPLRERREDIIPLTEHYIKLYDRKMGKSITGLTEMTLETFMNWYWPGNVRELRNTIESAFNFETTDKITLGSISELLEEINNKGAEYHAGLIESGNKALSDGQSSDIERVKQMLAAGCVNIEELLEDYERKIILEALKQNRKLKVAAEKLGISPQRLDYRLRKLNLKDFL
ncbi:MAG: sigma-54 interaction domain-containing protein [Anaerovoracaceae bacterium]